MAHTDRPILSDMSVFLDGPAPSTDLTDADRRLMDCLGALVRATSSYPTKLRMETLIRCRRMPGGENCSGRLTSLRTELGEIHWTCPRCKRRGTILGWRGTPWDLDDPLPPLEADPDPWLRVYLLESHVQLFQELPYLERQAERVLHGARHVRRHAMLEGRYGEIELLAGYASMESNHAESAERAQAWENVCRILERALGRN